MKNKYFIILGENKLKKVSNVNFLFPLKGLCVGLLKEYTIDEIPEQSYVYINRILDNEALDYFISLIEELEKKVEGIVFEDLGILEVLKKRKSSLKTIFYASHAVCSSSTANAYLKEVDELILSPDLAYEEINSIQEKVIRPVGLVLYANLPYMYSRRTLITNYALHTAQDISSPFLIEEPIHHQKFICIENEYGTVLYDTKKQDARQCFPLKNISFYLLNLQFEQIDDLEDWLTIFEKNESLLETTTGFLDKKTIYRLPPRSENK